MQKKRILVLTDHMPWGHRSIAKAIFNYLKENEKGNDLEIFYQEVKSEGGIVNDIYNFYYKYSPKLGRFFYKLDSKNLAVKIIDDLGLKNLPRIKDAVNKIKPDLIISAYFIHSHTLAKWKKETDQKFKLWTVMADPWTIYSASVVPGADLHLVYDKVGLKMAKNMGVEAKKVLVTGWWVRPEMYKEYNRKEIRKKLGFNDDRPIIFVGGGSLGTNSLMSILPALFFLKQKVGFIINTGTDKLTFNLVKNFIKFFNKARKDNQIIIKNFGWIENMAETLSACDMVFGKAGPNFLFDVVACQKPFVAITHIGGQEDGNIELINDKKLGWIREKSVRLINFLYQYLERPKYFENKFKETIKKEALNNKNSLKIVLERVKKDLL